MANFFEKMDNKIMASKLEQLMYMLKTKSTDEISGKIDRSNREELIKKMNEITPEKLKSMNIDVNKIKNTLTSADIEKIKSIAGKDSDAVMKKLNELFNK